MPRHRRLLPQLVLSVLLLLLFFFQQNVLATDSNASTPQSGTGSSGSVHATLAAMSDEQVRQLLIAELQKDVDAKDQSSSLKPAISGPGAPLAEILQKLNSETGQSENQLQKLLAGAPRLLPDLYKVFVTL